MLAALGNIIEPLRASPPFHRLWWSVFLAGSGRWSTLLVLGWLAFALTESEFAVGLLGAAAFAPLALGPLGEYSRIARHVWLYSSPAGG